MTKHFDPAEFRRKNAGARLDDQVELKSIMDALAARDAEIKGFAERAAAEIATHGRVLDETKSALAKLSTSGAELQDRLLQVEQKLARRGSGDALAFAGKSPGQEFVESDALKELVTKGRGTARHQLKSNATITSATSGDGGVGGAIVAHRLPGIVTPAERPMTIRDLLAQGVTTSNMVEFVRETGFSNNAATVEENPGSAKPKSDITFETASAGVKTIATIFKASKQALDDVPMLASYIDNRGRYGLRYKEEEQLLAGDGQGNNVLGLIPQATLFGWSTLSDLVESPQRADIIRLAMLQVRKAEYRPTGILMHPEDWAAIELLKDSNDHKYLWASPRALAAPGLWGLPVVDTMAIQPGEFMVGAFNIAATVWDRQQAMVEVANQNNDDFEKNMLTIRVEERLALTVFRPESFVHGYFDIVGSPSLNA